MVTDIKQPLEGLNEAAENAQKMTAELTEVNKKFSDTDNSVGMLLNDPEFAQSLKSTLENADLATFNLNKGMEALEYTWPFNKGFKRKQKAEEKDNN